MRPALRGRLMVGRLTLDQVVKVRVLAPQLDESPRVARGFCLQGGDEDGSARPGRESSAAIELLGHEVVARAVGVGTERTTRDEAGLPIEATCRLENIGSAGLQADASHSPLGCD